MTRPLAALAAAVAVAALTPAQDPKLPGPKIDWPEVEGFTRGKTTVFPQAELGYAVGYNAPGVTVTVYVYHGGRKEIPDGVKSDAVKGEMKGTVKALDDAMKAGFYTAVKEVGQEETVPLGKGKDAPQALRRSFEVVNPKVGERLSDTYLTGYKNHFVKFRVTYSPKDKDAAGKKAAELLEAVGAALK
jgi:hypothetical protein